MMAFHEVIYKDWIESLLIKESKNGLQYSIDIEADFQSCALPELGISVEEEEQDR